ncbi:HU family DNA-binding protein [Wolbachia endosymbiont of Ctenocephalides felis wCfeT]|uniref:HU family DNA-binding protein n=1 Tax=Wolbachia endosymbiont of Ctenocephalides felis wCfeT TaxID=2732593 RepID=UPI001445BD29
MLEFADTFLEEGESFRLHKVGRFYSVSIKEKKIRDLRSDEIIVVPPSRRIRFKAFFKLPQF